VCHHIKDKNLNGKTVPVHTTKAYKRRRRRRKKKRRRGGERQRERRKWRWVRREMGRRGRE
jgi:hypothetical protein